MTVNDQFRISAHAILTDCDGKVLQVKATYDGYRWGLPGGIVEPGETVHEALIRECREELEIDVTVLYMSGIYFHKAYHSHACVFRCEMPANSKIKLSKEHSDYRFFTLEEMSAVQRQRVLDCLQFDGKVKSRKF